MNRKKSGWQEIVKNNSFKKFMKIILGSDLSFLLKYGYDLTGIAKDEIKIGYVTTASKAARDQSFFEEVKKTIRKNGYFFEEIDIEGKTKDQLLDFFKDKNIVHVEGGNTFYLLKAIRETGFAEILKELLNQGKVYIGTSAGAYIMCPTIEVADWGSDGKEKFGLTDFTGLNYVPFVLKAHYRDEVEKIVREKMSTLKYPLRILKDGQGILVEDDKSTFFGEDEETRL
jgi:dipeptidase E